MLRRLFTAFDHSCYKHKCYKVYTIGDCYVAMAFMGIIFKFKFNVNLIYYMLLY